jgi:hypothetical protein
MEETGQKIDRDIAQKAALKSDFQNRLEMSPLLLAVCAIWLLFIVTGAGLLTRYKNTPGRDQAAPLTWPDRAQLARDSARPTLIMFLHSRCACSQASLGELERLLTSARGRASVHLYFYRPKGADRAWAHSDLYRTASAIPDVTVHEDEDGAEARLFHGETSGHTVLYSQKGELLFDGGITESRGHSGDSSGRAAVVGLLLGEPVAATRTPIFGCDIHDAKATANIAN